MRRLDPPSIRVRSVVDVCASTITDARLRHSLESEINALEVGESDFERHAAAGSLFTIASSSRVGVLTGPEMTWIYSNKLSKKNDAARPIYDGIKSSSPYGTCPLCAHRVVSTLDHYLPKARFPLFAITPVNLVPACMECNKAKLSKVSETEAEQTLHPYFDNVEGVTWLAAVIEERSPPAALFYVNEQTDSPLLSRIKSHFATFGLPWPAPQYLIQVL